MSAMRRILLGIGLSLYVALSAHAALVIPQSTSTVIAVGPFVDSTDGATLETGLTINAADVLLSKNGGTYAAKNSGGCAAAATTGMYLCTFNTTDSNTAGTLQVNIAVAGALPVYHELQVIPAATYAITYGTGATGLAPANITQVGGAAITSSAGVLAVNTTQWGGTAVASAVVGANAIQISGDATAADTLELAFDGTATGARLLGIDRLGAAAAVAAGTITLDAGASYADNSINGATIWGCGSTQGYCQFNSVASSTGDVLTLSHDWTVTPSGTVTYQLFGTAAGSGGGGATPAEVWGYAGARTLTAATNITSTGGTIPISGARVDASVGAYQAGSIPLKATVEGRTLDVTTTGGAGIDWANVEAQSTAVALTGTTISTSQAVASVIGAVASVTNPVTVGTNNDKAGYALSTAGNEAVLNVVVEDMGNISARCMMALLGSVLNGDYTTAGNTTTFRDNTGTEVRMTSTQTTTSRVVTVTCPTYP